jgi:hypothetical protein
MLLVVLALGGCSVAQNADNIDTVAVKVSEDGIRYKVVVIEGHRFIATQSDRGYWTFAGPIDR